MCIVKPIPTTDLTDGFRKGTLNRKLNNLEVDKSHQSQCIGSLVGQPTHLLKQLTHQIKFYLFHIQDWPQTFYFSENSMQVVYDLAQNSFDKSTIKYKNKFNKLFQDYSGQSDQVTLQYSPQGVKLALGRT